MKPIARALVVGVAFFFSLGLVGAGQTQERPAASERGKLPEWMAEFLPRTPEDVARAAVFDREGPWVLELGGGVHVNRCGMGFQIADEPPAYLDFIAQLACGHDAIVVGTAMPFAVRLNNRGTWLFTEFSLAVRRWIQPGGEPPASVHILVGGGVLHVNGQTTSVTSDPQPEAGKEALLFLKRAPGARAFTITGRPIHADTAWTASLGVPQLPYELQDGDVPFDRFVDDLAIAAGKCVRR